MSIANSDPYKALSFDRLHNYPGGLAKSHIIPLINDTLAGGSQSARQLRVTVNERYVLANFAQYLVAAH